MYALTGHITIKKGICILFCCICLGTTAYGQVEQFQQHAQTLCEDATFSSALVGIKAVTGEGEVMVSVNEAKMLAPASNMKLISTGTALFSLGPEYRFCTTLAHDGYISDGVLHGNLYIVGGGDPLLGSKDTVATALNEVFEQWEKDVRRAGIRSIEGTLVGDGRWLEGMGVEPTWQWGDLGTYYGAGVSGLMFYENMMSFTVSPGPEVGASVKMEPYYPGCSWMDFRFCGVTGEKGTGDRLYMYASEFEPVAEIRGTFGLDRGTKRVDCSNMFPEYTCAVYFKNHLERKGIRCINGAGDFKLKKDWMKEGTADSVMVIGSHYSPVLERIAFKTNHESNNLLAETLFRALGKENTGSSCIDSSYVALKGVLKKMHVGSSGLSLQDGSGLSRQNLVSADFMCRFLGAMMDSSCFEEYLWSLPVPGGNGTLQYNMKGVPDDVRTRFRIKSGSMNGVRCYSGYILPAGFTLERGAEIPQEIKDRTIIFSVMTNNCVSSTWKVRQILDRFMVELGK